LFAAIKAARGGTALGNPTHLSTLRNVVALHFVRNPHTLKIHNKSFADALDRHIDYLATTPFAAEAFYRNHGLVPAGPEAMRLGAEESQERIVTLHKQGGLFRISVQNLYEKVCDQERHRWAGESRTWRTRPPSRRQPAPRISGSP
jgi:hypothetical protein